MTYKYKNFDVTNMPTMKQINAQPKDYKAISLFAGCGGASTGLKMAGFDLVYANEFVPHAADTYELNSNIKVDRRDVRTITGSDILKKIGMKPGELDLMDASPPCFPAGSMVRVDGPYGGNSHYMPIEEIKCGKIVLSHTGQWQRVTATMSHLYTGLMYKIGGQFLQPIECTPEHPFWVLRDGVEQWIPADRIEAGDCIAIVMEDSPSEPVYPKSYHSILIHKFPVGQHVSIPEDNQLLTRDRWIWIPVVTISSYPVSNLTVYNISVEHDETYTINGIAVHNCKLFSAAASHTRMDKPANAVVEYSSGIHQRVDDLFPEFIRLLREIQPKVFIAENVKGLLNKNNKGFLVEFYRMMTKSGYRVELQLINGALCGAPQMRQRVVFQGVREDLNLAPHYPLPNKSELTLKQVFPYIQSVLMGGERGWADSNRPCPTITATAYRVGLTSVMSSPAIIRESESGEHRKLTLDELKTIFSFPPDFRFAHDPKKKPTVQEELNWERLGRSHLPLATYRIGRAIATGVLAKVNPKHRFVMPKLAVIKPSKTLAINPTPKTKAKLAKPVKKTKVAKKKK